MKQLIVILMVFLLYTSSFGQTESITNRDIALMTRSGLSEDLIIQKINESAVNFDTRVEDLINLQKAGVSDRVIKIMMDRASSSVPKANSVKDKPYSDSDVSIPTALNRFGNNQPKPSARIVLSKTEALKNAYTIAIKKSSLHPSRQALEKELFKRKDWQSLGLNIVRYEEDADLYIEIGYVSMSWITHRYVYRIYESNSGTVILAGETTSWGALAKNLARGISKRLTIAMAAAKKT